MSWKKTAKALLFPPPAVLPLLLLPAAALLIYTMTTLEQTNPLRIGSYVLAFYTLTVWCLRAPAIFRFFRRLPRENRLLSVWVSDHRLRLNVTLTGNVLWNVAYAGLQLGLGIYHRSGWYCSLAAYYTCLAVMRLFLVGHTLRHAPGTQPRQELLRYRACGWIFLFMNLALSAMMLHMIRQNRVLRHSEITTIAMATYTFATLTMAIVNVIRYRKYHSPAMSAAKAISLAAACVSMLTLENTMLTTFSTGDLTPHARLLFLSLSGGGICAGIVVMAVYMIVSANRKINEM